jgi:hypothetical protein
MHFFGRKIIFSSLKFFFLKVGRLTFMNIQIKKYESDNFVSEKHHTLGA